VQFSTAVTAELIGGTSDQQSSSEGSRYHPDAKMGDVGYQFPRPAYPARRPPYPAPKQVAVLMLRDRWYTHSVEVILRESAEPAAALLRR